MCVKKTSNGFREVLVDIERPSQGGVTQIKASDLSANKHDSDPNMPKFRNVLSATPTPWSMLLADRSPRFKGLQPGQRVEISSDAWAIARKAGELVAGRNAQQPSTEDGKESEEQKRVRENQRLSAPSKGGAGVIIDYGDDKAFGASFRAFKAHKQVDPLEQPGTADLTCNVDFAHLRNAVATTDSRSLGPMFQSHFLKALGVDQRVQALVANAANPQRQKDIQAAALRLVDPSGMGAQYKAFGIVAEAHLGADHVTSSTESLSDKYVKCYPFEM